VSDRAHSTPVGEVEGSIIARCAVCATRPKAIRRKSRYRQLTSFEDFAAVQAFDELRIVVFRD
jgi:hypothetical protein